MEDDGVAVPLAIPRQKGETQLEIKPNFHTFAMSA
jgi:hypothetical protein